MTDKQERLLQFILDFHKENGYSPSIREMAQGMGVSSPSTIKAMLDRLDNPINIPMTGEDAEKNELFREAQVMAREHPEDVAQLIRAWLVEE